MLSLWVQRLELGLRRGDCRLCLRQCGLHAAAPGAAQADQPCQRLLARRLRLRQCGAQLLRLQFEQQIVLAHLHAFGGQHTQDPTVTVLPTSTRDKVSTRAEKRKLRTSGEYRASITCTSTGRWRQAIVPPATTATSNSANMARISVLRVNIRGARPLRRH